MSAAAEAVPEADAETVAETGAATDITTDATIATTIELIKGIDNAIIKRVQMVNEQAQKIDVSNNTQLPKTCRDPLDPHIMTKLQLLDSAQWMAVHSWVFQMSVCQLEEEIYIVVILRLAKIYLQLKDDESLIDKMEKDFRVFQFLARYWIPGNMGKTRIIEYVGRVEVTRDINSIVEQFSEVFKGYPPAFIPTTKSATKTS